MCKYGLDCHAYRAGGCHGRLHPGDKGFVPTTLIRCGQGPECFFHNNTGACIFNHGESRVLSGETLGEGERVRQQTRPIDRLTYLFFTHTNQPWTDRETGINTIKPGMPVKRPS